jgi:hypothetical protein
VKKREEIIVARFISLSLTLKPFFFLSFSFISHPFLSFFPCFLFHSLKQKRKTSEHEMGAMSEEVVEEAGKDEGECEEEGMVEVEMAVNEEGVEEQEEEDQGGRIRIKFKRKRKGG